MSARSLARPARVDTPVALPAGHELAGRPASAPAARRVLKPASSVLPQDSQKAASGTGKYTASRGFMAYSKALRSIDVNTCTRPRPGLVHGPAKPGTAAAPAKKSTSAPVQQLPRRTQSSSPFLHGNNSVATSPAAFYKESRTTSTSPPGEVVDSPPASPTELATATTADKRSRVQSRGGRWTVTAKPVRRRILTF